MSSPPSVLTSLRYYEDLRSNTSNVDRPEGSNLDIVNRDHQVGICHLVTILGFIGFSNQQFTSGLYEIVAAVALAAHHLNTADGSLVDEVSELSQECPNLKFTLEVADLGASPGSSLAKVLDVTDDASIRKPCAILGATRSLLSVPTSMITGIRGYPQVSGASTSKVLDDKTMHPLFGRVVGSDHSNAYPLLQFLQDEWSVQHLAVLHFNEPYGNAYAEGLREAVKKKFPDVALVSVTMNYDELDEKAIAEAVESLKLTRFRYLFSIVFDVFDGILEEAYRQGIAGNPEYTWIFSDAFEPEAVLSRSFERGSILHKVYEGVGYYSFSAGSSAKHDMFVSQMSKLANEEDVALIANMTPPNAFLGDENYLRPIQSPFVGFFYDAAIALGLSACKSIANTTGASVLTLNGTFHYENLLQEGFDGVTGSVVLDAETGSRTSTFYSIVNFVEDEGNSNSDKLQFKQVVTDVFEAGNWNRLQDYIFSDGSSNIPPDLPPFVVDKNYLNLGTRTSTLVMCGIAVALAMGFAAWTWLHRDSRVVRASQPFFLYIICTGALVLACSIIPAIMDPSWASVEGSTVACNITGWLITVGFSLIFSALFTKTYRANKILRTKSFRRITVTVKDVLAPMIVLVGANILVLSLMSIFAPLEWEVIVIATDSLRDVPSETYGRCSIGYEQMPYLLTLGIINLAILLFAIHQAWCARRISTEFSESIYIFRALATDFLVIFCCFPVVLLANDNPNAYVFVICVIAFVTSTSSLLWIFVPKIHFYRHDQRKRSKGGENVHISGLDVTSQLESAVSDYGERIITRESAPTLANENSMLRRQLESLKSAARLDDDQTRNTNKDE